MLHDSIQRIEHPDIDHNQPASINKFKQKNTTNKGMEIPIQTCHKKPPLLEKISQKSVRIGVCSQKKIDDSDMDSPQKDESIEKIEIDCTSLKNMKDESGHIKDGKASFKSVNASKLNEAEAKDGLKASKTMKSVKSIKFNEKKDVFTYKEEQNKENGPSRSLRKLTKSEKRIANKQSDQCCLIM